MAARRIWYLTALLASGGYYIASGEWLSAVLLAVVAGLPWLSLLVSLPAIRGFRAAPAGVDIVQMGEETELWLLGSCAAPMPPFRGKLRLHRCFTGEESRYRAEKGFPTEHCGGVAVNVERIKVYDYLGLFAFRVKAVEKKTVIVRPAKRPVPLPPQVEQFTPRQWKPKPGGGFAENHEMRLYRPGDSLNQIHWKLSAKTGDLILREPMEPIRGLVLLTVTLRGQPEALDRKLGRLVWMGEYLLDKGVPFEVRALTGEGLLIFPVGAVTELYKAVDKLLCTPVAENGSIRDTVFDASWQYHIGGEADET